MSQACPTIIIVNLLIFRDQMTTPEQINEESLVQFVNVTCVPHFKPDAEASWVTKESKHLIHYWFNPNMTSTLLQVAGDIEAWADNDYLTRINRLPAPCVVGRYHLTVETMDIRGATYDRQKMAQSDASSILHDAEHFNIGVYGSVPCVCCCTII